MDTLTTIHVYKADLQKVWDAFTQPEIMKQWWAPGPMKSGHMEVDLGVGKRFRYAFEAPNGFKMWGQGKYTAIKEPLELSYKDSFTDQDGNPVPRSYYSKEGAKEGDEIIEEQAHITFKKTDEGTEMTFVIDYYADPAMKDMVKGSWDTMFTKLHEVI